MCIFGLDICEDLVDFWEDGVKTKKTMEYSLRTTQQNLIARAGSLHIILFPFLMQYHITSYERDQANNAKALRNVVEKIVNERREAIKKNPALASQGDFLTMILTEDHFKNRHERTVDECLTFFFAGSQTSSVVT